jgi:phosphoribosylamine---glycine ligase
VQRDLRSSGLLLHEEWAADDVAFGGGESYDLGKMKAAVIGKDGRTTAIVRSLEKSARIDGPVSTLFAGTIGKTPKSLEKAQAELRKKAKEVQPDFVVIGPEEPLALGFVDLLRDEFGIPCVGPTKRLAQLEASKAWTRQLLQKHGIPGNPSFRVFTEMKEIAPYLETLGHFVIKPDGLTGGKGVKVSDVHLFSVREATDYCEELFRAGQPSVVIEERLDGEEFSLQSFSDGTVVKHMPIVQDHKRVGIGDTGPNTGGMGSYSCPDGSLPFLSAADLEMASSINSAVVRALKEETGELYKGILYGGFIATRDGIRLIEYNVRFGDPEALNVLSLLETDFADVCEAIIKGTLASAKTAFAARATVCKYVVPQNYPENPVKGVKVDLRDLPAESERLKIFRAAIDESNCLTGSRAIAFVGIADHLEGAERIAEEAAMAVHGPVYHRADIGTRELIESKLDHMRRLRSDRPSALVQ